MKHMKRVITLLLAVVMTLAMSSVGVFAANGANNAHVIKITNSDEVGTHTYSAYQVFAGDYDATSNKLSNITWGTGVDGAAILTAVKADTATFGADAANATSAADVAALLGGAGTDTLQAKKFAAIVGEHLATVAGTSSATKSPYTISVTGDGYYFIKDGAIPTDQDNTDPTKVDSATRFILEVVKDVNVIAKSSTMESAKKIDRDTNDSTGASETNKDSADYDIGDIIPYTITATLPSNYADYEKFYLKFTDTMSTGLTYNGDAKIYYGSSDTTGTSIDFGTAPNLSFEIKDLKTVAASLGNGDVVTIKYTATLNDNAVTGSEGNPNTSKVTFNNDPNNSGEGKPTQDTPVDKVVVFTYEVDVDKVNENKEALTGANFALYKLFKDEAELAKANSKRASDKQYTKATEIKYDNNSKTYNMGSAVYALVKEITVEGSEFDFKGVDDGTYLLVETKTPDGYNSVQPMKFTISATHTDGPTPALTSVTGTDEKGSDTKLDAISLGTIDGNKGVETSVVNEEGTVLPSTGGIGTVIFYVLGSLLVVGCGIVLISKRRTNSTK